jgi:lysophospholipase L1-like esterase
MIKVINNFKTAFPKSSIILVSVHDKAMKKGSEFITDPAIIQLHAVQKTIAEKADVAFWSLFDAMGGENSMATWVSANPPLAFKDYIHFNEQGAKKVAQLFTEALLDEFAKFK